MASDFVFRLDRHRRFLLGPSLALDQILWADCPASDCADRPLSGRDFASPATSCVNHSRGNLPVGEPVFLLGQAASKKGKESAAKR